MIHFIRGKLAILNPGSIVIENNGIGYGLTVPENSSFFLAKEGEEVFAYTSMIVREDDISLYGFSDRETQRMFHRLMSVTGVGPLRVRVTGERSADCRNLEVGKWVAVAA